MPWQILIPPQPKERIRQFLSELSIEGQLQGESEEAKCAMRSQFAAAKETAALLSDALPGPKIAGDMSGHHSGHAVAQPGGGARTAVNVYQVRFLGE